MALDSPQLVEFCNDELRPVADMLVALSIRADAAVAEYNARNLGTVINDGGSSNTVVDGSASDGRTPRTGGDVFNFVTLLQDFAAFMTTGRHDVVNGWNVTGHKG